MRTREVLSHTAGHTAVIDKARDPKDSVFFLVQNVSFLSKDKYIIFKVVILPRQPLLKVTLQEENIIGVLL